MDVMHFTLSYLVWHYTRGFRDVTAFWLNMAWFVTHFFSIPLLLRTLFSPWKRVTTEHTKQGLEDYAETILFNIMSRVVGAFIRLILILIGSTILVLVLTLYLAFIGLWTLLPAIALFSLVNGLSLVSL